MVNNVRKVLIAFSSHVHYFVLHVRVVSFAFKYVRYIKIRHIICNLVPLVFFSVIVYSDLSIFVEHNFSMSAE